MNLGKTLPKVPYMLKCIERDHRADRSVRLRESLDIGYTVDSRAWPEIDSDIGLVREEIAQLCNSLLAGYLIGTDFQNRPWAIQRLRCRTSHAVDKLIHERSFHLARF